MANNNNNNVNSQQLENLIQSLSQKLNLSSNQIKQNLNSGQLGNLTKNMRESDMTKIQQVLNNPAMAKQILGSKQAQDIIKQLKK